MFVVMRTECFFLNCCLLCFSREEEFSALFSKNKRHMVKGRNKEKTVIYVHPYKKFGPSCLVRASEYQNYQLPLISQLKVK